MKKTERHHQPPPPMFSTSKRADERQALAIAQRALSADPDVLDIHLGYRFKNGWITDERVVVVELRQKLSPLEVRTTRRDLVPSRFGRLGVDVRTGGLAIQLADLGLDLEELEAPSKGGQYREPKHLTLAPVEERMQAVFHVSPDAGFPTLKKFLGRVKSHLTATIYEWEPTHISTAIEEAMEGTGKTLTMVTMPHFGIAQGTQDAVADMRKRIGKKFKHVFASVGYGKLIPSAYHIKVASRDGEEFWLSSGNWKDSNQADINPAGEHSTDPAPLLKHNREWHAVIANPTLADLFQRYVEFDFDEAKRLPFTKGPAAAFPDVFVPEAAFFQKEVRGAVRYFEPLELDQVLEIQPLLTPDRDSNQKHIFVKFATELAESAMRRILVENQSFSIGEQQEYEELFSTLIKKQRDGIDVRIIFRDPRQFPRGAETLQRTLEKVKEFGFDMGHVKVQKNCHTKGIIVDSEQVILGSQNLTPAGSLFNRDASLLVRDANVASYFEKIFEFDWDHLAAQEAEEAVGGIRIAKPGEPTPAGFRRVSVSELLSQD
ncbi:MAG: phospholipase D-like domain-containing protein [Gemmatimonadaceae bacterium]